MECARVRQCGFVRWPLLGALGLVALVAAAAFVLTQQGTTPDGTGDPPDPVHAVSGSPPTIAILPFEVIGSDQGQDYLAHGLTADLTADLSKLSGLTVIGTWATGTGIPADRPPLSAARYRLLGRVGRDAGRIQLHVALIEAATGEQVWARRYERPFSELLTVREEVAGSLAEALAVAPSEDERRRLTQRSTQNISAYELFLRAQAKLLLRNEAANRRARGLYEEAIRLDPDFARAYGGLALTHAADYRNRWTEDVDASLRLARETADLAARMNPTLPEVLWVLAYVHVQERDHARALEYLDRAIALDPSFADAYALKGSLKTHAGEPQESVTLLRHAMRLNPTSGYLYFLVLGRAHFFLGDMARALENLNEAVARNPTALQPHIFLAAAASSAGDRETAEWEALEVLNLSPGFSLERWLATYPLTDQAQKQALSASLAEIGLVD